jgi:type I restriction enzyme R subunit
VKINEIIQNLATANDIDTVIRQTKQDGWRGNKVKERMIKNAIKKYLPLP